MDEIIDKAKEELKILETLHPYHFDYIKLELHSFISLLHSQQLLDTLPSTSNATTQASSTSMKRKMRKRKQRDRVDVVLDNAHACLRKIQDFKNST